MVPVIQQLHRQLSDEQTRQSLINAASRREERLLELGKLDLDCQLLQSDGQPLKAEGLYRRIVDLEQKLEPVMTNSVTSDLEDQLIRSWKLLRG